MLNEASVKLGKQRSIIRELFEYGKRRAAEIGEENVYDFSIGNPSVEPPKEVNGMAVQIICSTDPVKLHGYTSAQGDFDVRQKISDSLNRRFQANCRPENLYICTGAAGAVCGTLNGLACAGDEFVVQAPFFPEYRVFIEKTGSKFVEIPPETADFQINFPELEKAINPHTKGIIVNSPNNPSGAVYTRDTLVKLASLLNAKNAEYGHPIYIISDEPYREICYPGFEVSWIPSIYPNTIVCYSFSKALSVPGERLGYVFVPSECADAEDVYAAVAGASRAMGYVSAPSLFQRVCAECCDLTADISVYERNRQLLVHGLTSCGMDCGNPGGTFYLFPKTLDENDVAFCEKAKELDILILPGSGFGCPGHTRISYCVPTERVERSLAAFKKLASYYGK